MHGPYNVKSFKNRTSFLWYPGKRCSTTEKWSGQRPSWCKILQSSWKFSAHFYFGFTALQYEHLLHVIFVQVLHFLVGTKQNPSEYGLLFQMFAMWVRLPVFHDSNFTTSIEETLSTYVFFIFKHVRYFDTPTVFNTVHPLAKTVYKQERIHVTALPARFRYRAIW